MATSKGRARAGLIAALVIILGAFGFLLTGGISDNLVFFLTPGELLEQVEERYDQPVRLGGLVAGNSVVWNAQELDLRFTMVDEAGTGVTVHAIKAPPQMFREGIGVVVEGRYTRAGVFEATNVLVKHSNEYRVPEEGHDAQQLIRTLVSETGS
ncbi:MAG: cytochrome c maturation protein CcmE [Gemmatimonadetes bacterium]|nr:cytochrome c maturation protein CcmE [Gemmatimonadota bacterium]